MELAGLDAQIAWVDEQLALIGDAPAVESEVLCSVLSLRERIDALAVLATATWDRAERWRAAGALTPVAWFRHHAQLAASDAKALVRSARLVARCPAMAKSLAHGELHSGHIDAWARHVTPPRADLFDDHADALIDATRRLTVDQTALAARRWASHADDLLNRGEPEDLHERRGVWFGRTGDMEMGRLLGAPEQLAALKAALDKLEPPDPKATPGGARSLAQRRYDALVSLAGLGLQDRHGRIDPTHTVNIVIDAATLAGEFNPAGRSDILGGGSVLPARVQRLLCDSWISRVILGPDGEILDLGRTARLFSPAQQRAIMIRDGGCALACCDRPPQWCDAHHLDPYGPPTNGLTDIDNGLALCRPHHTLVHKGWKPRQDPHGNWYLEPP
jgi:hypothetical protein